jgi:hypothetical protein
MLIRLVVFSPEHYKPRRVVDRGNMLARNDVDVTFAGIGRIDGFSTGIVRMVNWI